MLGGRRTLMGMRHTLRVFAAACAVYGIMAACSAEPTRRPVEATGGGGQGGAVGAGGQVAAGGVGGSGVAGQAGTSPVPDASAAGAGGAGCDCPGLAWELAATVQCVEFGDPAGFFGAEWEHGMADDLEVTARVRTLYDSATATGFNTASHGYLIDGGFLRFACQNKVDRIRIVTLR